MLTLKRSVVAAIALAALVLVLAGCGGGSGARDASPAAVGAVTMLDNAFQPPHVEVPARTHGHVDERRPGAA